MITDADRVGKLGGEKRVRPGTLGFLERLGALHDGHDRSIPIAVTARASSAWARKARTKKGAEAEGAGRRRGRRLSFKGKKNVFWTGEKASSGECRRTCRGPSRFSTPSLQGGRISTLPAGTMWVVPRFASLYDLKETTECESLAVNGATRERESEAGV